MVTERRISAGEFKSTCLRLMDDVQRSKRSVVITKRGKPVAKLVPYSEDALQLFGALAGTAHVHGDLIQPIDVLWEANG